MERVVVLFGGLWVTDMQLVECLTELVHRVNLHGGVAEDLFICFFFFFQARCAFFFSLCSRLGRHAKGAQVLSAVAAGGQSSVVLLSTFFKRDLLGLDQTYPTNVVV